MRRMLWFLPVAGAAAVAAALGTGLTGAAQQAGRPTDLKPAVSLPITQVVLFSSGVGYFGRSGEVEGDARVDLSFQERDINDLLKSMVLMDLGGGHVSAVSYDSREPTARTLASFAINLDGSPSLAQLLMQARGEKVEVTLQQTAVAQPASLAGSIVGIETKPLPAGDDGKGAVVQAEVLNLWCADGLRSVKLTDVQRLRFSNPVIEDEFRRALEVLAQSHDQQKKAVSLHFSGEGKRQVRVGYVVEHPIWKTSYRLVLDKDGEPFLQGWGIVENPTDEDWRGVGMALVSGRPISFKMDLYNPLYVPRPVVEPELFASLRPPTYSGDLGLDDQSTRADGKEAEKAEADAGRAGGYGGRGLDRQQGQRAGAAAEPKPAERMRLAGVAPASPDERRKALEFAEELKQRMDVSRGVAAAATASQLGDYFQYVIDRPVDLPRQKSALLPIVNKEIQAKRLSIYNESVQARHPLLGLRVKNTTGLHLMQGPVTVLEGSTYAGDTRWLDVQPGEERLVSYAIDLGTEVDPKAGDSTSRITEVKAVKGVLHTTTRVRQEKLYRAANRSGQDRTLLIEHPNRKGSEFEVVSEPKPAEETAEVYRFELKLPAGKSQTLSVVEERDVESTVALSNASDDQIRYFTRLRQVSPGLKAALEKALGLKGSWDEARREIQAVQQRIQTITQDQARLRQNLRELPREAEAYKRYLQKFDEQEKEMDALHEKLKGLQAQEHERRVAYETFLQNLTVS